MLFCAIKVQFKMCSKTSHSMLIMARSTEVNHPPAYGISDSAIIVDCMDPQWITSKLSLHFLR